VPSPSDINIEVGDRFGKWTVISLDAKRYKGHIQVRVRCDCGSERDIPRSYLVRLERPSRQCKQCARRFCADMRFGSRRPNGGY
jgi:hypothetical protein